MGTFIPKTPDKNKQKPAATTPDVGNVEEVEIPLASDAGEPVKTDGSVVQVDDNGRVTENGKPYVGIKPVPMPEVPEMVQPQQAPLMTNYRDILEKVGGYGDRSAQLERQRKRELSNKRLLQIFDGLNALSNLYAVSKGAPNAHNPQQDLSRQARARIDNIDKQRDVNRAAYLNAYLRGYGQDLADQRYRQRSYDNLANAENRRRLAKYNKEASEAMAHNRQYYSAVNAANKFEQTKDLVDRRGEIAKDVAKVRGEQARETKRVAPAKAQSTGNGGNKPVIKKSDTVVGSLLPKPKGGGSLLPKPKQQ